MFLLKWHILLRNNSTNSQTWSWEIFKIKYFTTPQHLKTLQNFKTSLYATLSLFDFIAIMLNWMKFSQLARSDIMDFN